MAIVYLAIPGSVRREDEHAFTLLELIVVMGILSLVLVAIVPAFTTIKNSADLTTAAYTISDTLQQARMHAVSNNTYVWVGFYEEDQTAQVATNHQPPYSGAGRVLLATVASIDGTAIFDSSDSGAPLPAPRLRQIGKLIRIEGIHVTDVGAPSGGNADTLDGRPSAYSDSQFGHFARISSDDSNADTTKFPFTAQNYTFYKTIRFNPRGEANINSTYSMKNPAEIGLRPTHGNVVDLTTGNVAAIQFGGVGSNLKIYRR